MHILNASWVLLANYAEYVHSKIDINEIPLKFGEWCEMNDCTKDHPPHP